MSNAFDPTDRLCVDTLRALAIDMIQKADSGHPGLPLGAAPMAYVLWDRHLRHDPSDPRWPDRDRFVLSPGHGSALLYALLHLTGYELSLEELRGFRQWGTRTPGHPEYGLTPGVEATTGPLGQGTANAVGMAIAERFLAHRYNRPGRAIVDHHTFALVSDGDVMEGVSAEAASLAGHLRLGKLVCLYDANDVTLDGPTSLAFSTEDVGRRYEAYGWQVLRVERGDTDLEAIDEAIRAAKAETGRPSIIVVKTTIGFGSPSKGGTCAAHGAPLGAAEVAATKKALGLDPSLSFHLPEPAVRHMRSALERGRAARAAWRTRLDAWGAENQELGREWQLALGGRLPDGWDAELAAPQPGGGEATRVSSGKSLRAIARRVPWLFGGDADLSSSTQTALAGAGDFDGQTGAGRNLHFGVREHAMAAVANGLAYHGGVRPYVSTFFSFADYMRPSMRLAALSRLPVTYVFTHDSVAVGEDGPTHQPVEHLAALRTFPGLDVVRPADASETHEAWRHAMTRADGPVALVLTRQKVPALDRSRLGPASGLARGAYVLADADRGEPKAVVIATGSEVAVALAARELLARDGIGVRVVSMPCWEAFRRQPQSYRDEVLPPSLAARVSVEAGVSFGWREWIGDRGAAVGVDRFGASAPGEVLMREMGMTAERVAEAVRSVL
jgi:transketolase